MIEQLELEIEQSVLASVLVEPKYIKKCILDIEPNDFIDFKNKEIYQSMLRLYNKPLAIDYRTLLDDLTKHKTGVDIDYLIELTNMLPTAENLDTYILQLREQSNMRKLFVGFDNVKNDKTITSQEAINYITNVSDNLKLVNNDPVKMIHDGIDEYFNDLADGKLNNTAHRTLFTKLDTRVMIQDGDYITVAAHTGFGKSALVMNFSKHFAMQGEIGLVISAEMTKKQWTNRLLANISGVANKRIQRKIELTKDEIFKITRCASQLKALDIMIHDSGYMTIEHIVSLAHKLKQKNNLDYLIVDHIGLIGTSKRVTGDTQKVSYISNTLKQLALNLKIPVIVVSQFNRNANDPKNGKRREPVIDDLMSSSSVGKDANIVMLLYSTHEDAEEYTNRFCILKIAKNRDGECGKIPMVFKADKQMFREVDYDPVTQRSTEIPLDKIGG